MMEWNGYGTKERWQDARRRATLQKSRKRSNLLERIYWPLTLWLIVLYFVLEKVWR